jgi:hypothetical protein
MVVFKDVQGHAGEGAHPASGSAEPPPIGLPAFVVNDFTQQIEPRNGGPSNAKCQSLKKNCRGHIGRAKFLSQLDVSRRCRGSTMQKNANEDEWSRFSPTRKSGHYSVFRSK